MNYVWNRNIIMWKVELTVSQLLMLSIIVSSRNMLPELIVDNNLIMTCGINSLESTVKEAKILRKTRIVGSQVEKIASYLNYGTLVKTNKPDERQWTILYNRTSGAAPIYFKIDDFTCQDSGLYICNVVNTWGPVQQTIQKFTCANKTFQTAHQKFNQVTVKHQSLSPDKSEKKKIPNASLSLDNIDKTTHHQSLPSDHNDNETPQYPFLSPDNTYQKTTTHQSLPSDHTTPQYPFLSPDNSDQTFMTPQSLPSDHNDHTTPQYPFLSPDTIYQTTMTPQSLPSDHNDHTTPQYPFLSPDNSDQTTMTHQSLPSDHIEKVSKTQQSYTIEKIALCVVTVLGCLVTAGLALFAYWKRSHIMSMLAYKVPSLKKTLHTTHYGSDLHVDDETAQPHDR